MFTGFLRVVSFLPKNGFYFTKMLLHTNKVGKQAAGNKLVNRKHGNPLTSFPVMETFYSIQGEGYNTGKAAFFIRLAGCDVGCVWCDVKESWDAKQHSVRSIKELIAEIKSSGAVNVIITGGEPCMYNLDSLTAELKNHNLNIWLETSGAYPITGTFDWICVSPKKFKFPVTESLKKANELKVVIYNKSDFDWAEENKSGSLKETSGSIEQLLKTKKNCHFFLQPEYSVFEKVMPLITDYVKRNPQWQISLQTHKIIGVR